MKVDKFLVNHLRALRGDIKLTQQLYKDRIIVEYNAKTNTNIYQLNYIIQLNFNHYTI